MGEHNYKEGQEISHIYLTGGEVLSAGGQYKIVVTMESGMHCDIPHAVVLINGDIHQKFCLHHVEGVQFKSAEGVEG